MIVRRYRVPGGYSWNAGPLILRIPTACNQPNQKAQRKREPLQASRCSASVPGPQQQPEIRAGHMNQEPLENVAVFSQVRSPHAAGFLAVGEGPLDQLATLAQKPFSFRSLQASPIGVDHFPLCFLADPVPLTRLLLLGNIGADTSGLHLL